MTPAGGDGGLRLTVDHPSPLAAGAPVAWRLTVTNDTGGDVLLTFASGQQGDVVLRTGDGREAYRWSDGMVFTQAVAEVPVPAGGAISVELAGGLDVEPGAYELVALVPAHPAPDPVGRPVTVVGRPPVPSVP